ncbi:SMP-30/gluconolactonase/LRE family protein [Streptomyces sp. J2-1]|uniref:SMP-30/gluconolactonase/LRE family protein n=1 Tax=Streptomyces corallincola TaxID=2851888 RepID=UPI001C38212A|nr:SMP-30/gluconolactonase/LRE family protein [Streptomyces corallincola]MBV2354092.1 SMP-30/gluconolactonase/LRE family protein [Streptomyces corallincola]
MTGQPLPTRPDRLELGEGIRWTGDTVVLVDILKGRLFTTPDDPDLPLEEMLRLPVPLGAVAPVAGRPGTWIAAAGTGICLLAPDTAPVWLATPEDRPGPVMRMNDGVTDPSGRFWAGSMAYDNTEGAGSLYRVDHDGTVERALDGITIPNGPAFTADGRTLYLADSAHAIVRRYSVDPGTGRLGAPEDFLTADEGGPDGMTVDAEGALWCAFWGTGTVRRYLPDGTLDRVVTLPASQPAGVCLEGTRLHITTATVGLDTPGPYDGGVFTVPVEVPGRPTPAFRLDPSAPVAGDLA